HRLSCRLCPAYCLRKHLYAVKRAPSQNACWRALGLSIATARLETMRARAILVCKCPDFRGVAMAKQQKCPNCGRYRATERGILTKSLKCSYCGATSTPRKGKARKSGLFSKRVVRVNKVYVTTGGQKWERNWRNAREEALERAGHRCTWCGARENL